MVDTSDEREVRVMTEDMPRRRGRVVVPELFGYYEVCECLSVSRTNLKFVRDLPEPVADLQCGRIWRADEIKEFAKEYELRRAARRGVA